MQTSVNLKPYIFPEDGLIVGKGEEHVGYITDVSEDHIQLYAPLEQASEETGPLRLVPSRIGSGQPTLRGWTICSACADGDKGARALPRVKCSPFSRFASQAQQR